ncbi:MAG: tyrosine--tRNA ligase [Thaumarchaeota archaeon]|nr:tyrosine--tRNA ligase [Nitrososphaerota archaeon]MCY3975930.1 tyrosine--tRNA ligase [Nitrososphaerota archaeon]
MDITKKIDIIKLPPTNEVITDIELLELLKTNNQPKHYIGLEISGFLHLGSLILIGFKVNDFIQAGIKCNIFLADWHTLINDKIGNLSEITKISKYYEKAFNIVCPEAKIILGSDFYRTQSEYWLDLVRLTKNLSLPRAIRTITIMGRSEKEKIDVAKLLYSSMQATDIHALDIDIAHSGMDQRKIHMVVREIFPKLNWKKPIAVHHQILSSLKLSKLSNVNKMSKSDINSGIFIHDSDNLIKSKIKRAWCESGNIISNPLLEIMKNIIFHEFSEIIIERPIKFGGNITYYNYEEMEIDFAEKKIHPMDLKSSTCYYLLKIIQPIRNKLKLDQDIIEIINKNY